ncbi:pickpocket protein 28-like [Bactrocera neohumeralis]|uniref:pickpocket protein 28-like n=1 Tax=Bactrocera neohumeralis TaxID=98809 RepID=UPI0021651558|nr:pickpocket protein 28-like [Bactrocera neohumeralis]
MNQALKSKVSNNSESSMEYSFLKLLCGSDPNITALNTIEDWSFSSSFVLNTSQSCERMLLKCNFGGVEYNCTELFHPVILDEGLCCTFNSLDQVYKFTNISSKVFFNKTYPPNVKPVDWSLENGYLNPLPKYFSPMKAVGFGQTLGLNIILNVERDEYSCSSGKSIGFKVTVGNPEDEPNVHESGLLLGPGLESIIRIIPSHQEADQKLSVLSRKYRNCVFEREHKLSVFSHYSYLNCMYECRTKTTLSICGCVQPYMITRYSNHTICSYKDYQCVQEIQYLLKNKRFQIPCGQKCWIGCFLKKYKVDIFSANLKKSLMEESNTLFANVTDTYVKENIAIANFYLQRYSYKSTKQSPYIDSIDVLSSVGGLIGVFMGFSFISFAEIIYFFCIRSRRLNTDRKIGNSERRPCALLANRPKTRFINPYKTPVYSLYQRNKFKSPRKM